MTTTEAPATGHSRPLSLATRVLLFVALAVLLCATLLATMLQNSIEAHFAEQDAGELQAVAHSVLHTLKEPGLGPQQHHASLHQVLTGHHQTYYLVLGADEKPLLSADGADLTPLFQLTQAIEKITPADLVSWQQADHTYRGAILQGPDGTRIAVAMEMEFHLHYLDLLRWTLWLTIAAAVALILLAAWFGVRQGLLPLRQLSNDIRQISAERLHVRLEPEQVPVELAELVQSFNQMIENLQQGFTRLSEFSADIAHELRTPLSNLITQTQVSLSKERSLDEYRELLYSNLEEQERLARMVSDMLWLAKTEHGLYKLQREPIALQSLSCQLFEFFEVIAEEKSVQLQYDGPSVTLQADKLMLQRALSNLLSNAIRHASAHSTVKIVVSNSNHHLDIRVRNQGTLIAPEHLPRLFERFYRVDPSRQRHSDGAGLGLAMVKSIAELHGAQIIASSVFINGDDPTLAQTEFVLHWPQ